MIYVVVISCEDYYKCELFDNELIALEMVKSELKHNLNWKQKIYNKCWHYGDKNFMRIEPRDVKSKVPATKIKAKTNDDLIHCQSNLDDLSGYPV